MPTWMLLIVSLAASCIAGAIWGDIPAVFKARYGTNETLVYPDDELCCYSANIIFRSFMGKSFWFKYSWNYKSTD